MHTFQKYIDPERAKQMAEQKENAIRQENIACWMMREAKELEENNCVSTIVDFNQTCVSLTPGDDTIYGIEYANYTLNKARRSE